MAKSYAEINEKIRKGTAVVLTAEEVAELSRSVSPREIAKKVDVVTTGTFGAMCSSGAFINFGHAEPPIRMEKIELNGVRVSGGLAAVDTYVVPPTAIPTVPLTEAPISLKTSSTGKTSPWRLGARARTVTPANTSKR